MPCKTLDLTGFLIGFRVIFFPNFEIFRVNNDVRWSSCMAPVLFQPNKLPRYTAELRDLHADQFILSYNWLLFLISEVKG